MEERFDFDSGLGRRGLIKGLGAAGASLAAVLASPRRVLAAAEETTMVQTTTDQGRTVSAALALPETMPAPAVLLVHEWWGLNDHIKATAQEFARHGYVALAVDLFDGAVAETPDRARELVRSVEGAEARDTLGAWMAWLRDHDRTTGRIGTVGWCFGGAWSLNASLVAAADATVVYYGKVTPPASELEALEGPVLGHFAERDKWIDEEMVAGFRQEMEKAGRAGQLTVHWYSADHAFANPTQGNYDKEDARTAWERTLAFFDTHLKS